jgi:hypothetical protein
MFHRDGDVFLAVVAGSPALGLEFVPRSSIWIPFHLTPAPGTVRLVDTHLRRRPALMPAPNEQRRSMRSDTRDRAAMLTAGSVRAGMVIG